MINPYFNYILYAFFIYCSMVTFEWPIRKNFLKGENSYCSGNGDNYYSGGAERYLLDLYEVCKNIGLKLRIYQKGNYNFFRFYNDIEIVGLTSKNQDYNYQYNQDMEILKQYSSIEKK